MTDKPQAPAPAGELKLTQAQLIELLREARKPYVDEDAAAQKEREREKLRASERERLENIAAEQEACAHLREDNSSAIAWMPMRNKAGTITVGVCQRCQLVVAPDHPRWGELIRVPTRTGVMAGLI